MWVISYSAFFHFFLTYNLGNVCGGEREREKLLLGLQQCPTIVTHHMDLQILWHSGCPIITNEGHIWMIGPLDKGCKNMMRLGTSSKFNYDQILWIELSFNSFTIPFYLALYYPFCKFISLFYTKFNVTNLYFIFFSFFSKKKSSTVILYLDLIIYILIQ